ncbi:pyocin activator PrtN family protein [Vibrio mediterranei]|nr:pyocin activator PrtN family protein [Vibrio mediterranei]
MNTEFGLLAAFNDSIIPVPDICEVFFDCKQKTANQKIRSFTFPIPAFSLTSGDRNEYFVTIEDLAAYIDEKYATEKSNLEEWNASFCFVLLYFAFVTRVACETEDSQISSLKMQ